MAGGEYVLGVGEGGGGAGGKVNDVICHFNETTLTTVLWTDERGKGGSQETKYKAPAKPR